MYTLTIKQPWASAIVLGLKSVENRTWSTNHRGPLAIHAGLSIDPEGEQVLETAGVALPQNCEDLPRGVILGVVDLIDVIPYPSPGGEQQTLGPDFESVDPHALADNALATGPYCWVLANPRAYPTPISCTGQRGLWEVDVDKLPFG